MLFFDVANGNPNGDPDAGNLPRMDPETSQGLVSDVALKRKVRNYVSAAHEGAAGHAVHMTERAVLNDTHKLAYDAMGLKPVAKKLPKDEEAEQLTRWMCDNFFDIRSFGAVMTTEVNAGQVRGPVQLSFARSEEPILPLEISITRSSVTNEKDRDKERTMGRKHIVPYGLYRAHGFINAKLAEKTGFSQADLDTLWTAFRDMFDLDRSAARGEMAMRRLIAFKHDSALGNAQAHKLFDRVTVERTDGDRTIPVGDPRTHNLRPARAFSDYAIKLDDSDLPAGVTLVEPFRSRPALGPATLAVLPDRVDKGGRETRPGLRLLLNVELGSQAHDLVELRGGTPCPVEYKRGRPKAHRADEVQLCAQALCLEEMFGCPTREGVLFYGKTQRRRAVALDDDLRALSLSTARAAPVSPST